MHWPKAEFSKLRLVCKRWSVLIQDKSLRSINDDTDEETDRFVVMLNNEKKHFAKLTDYLGNNSQNEITRDMRAILIDWLVDVVSEFKMNRDTLFLSVFYVDRYLSAVRQPLARIKLQLLGVTALLIAAKYDEIYAPAIGDLVYICDGAYTAEEILAMELTVLNVLQFEVTACTSQRFLDYFLKIGNRLLLNNNNAAEQVDKINNLSQYLIELSLLDYRFIRYHASLLGAAVYCLALHGAGYIYNNWDRFLTESSYSLNDIKHCMQELLELHQGAPSLQLRSVASKLSTEHGGVGRLRIPDINF